MTATDKVCVVDGCTSPWRTRRMCQNHYEQHRTRMKAYGRWGERGSFVDAQPVRDHIATLQDAGISWKRLHQLSGVALSSISRIVNGRTERGEGPAIHVTQTTADRILAVDVPVVWWTHATAGRVGDHTGTTRRLQALVAIGYTQTYLCDRLGVDVANGTVLFYGKRPLRAGTARGAAALYDELSMTPGPSKRSRNRAAKLGWLAPLDWDDDLIDDPAAPPAIDPDDREGRPRLSRWWRSQPCEVDGCRKTRVGVGNLLCNTHNQLKVYAEKKEKAA